MSVVAEKTHVTLSGAINGEYVVEEQRADGSLVLAPDGDAYPTVFWPEMLERSGACELTEEEWQDFLAEYGPHMLPPDGEG